MCLRIHMQLGEGKTRGGESAISLCFMAVNEKFNQKLLFFSLKNRKHDDVMFFSSSCAVLCSSGPSGCFHKSPVRVSTGFMSIQWVEFGVLTNGRL